MFKLSNLFGGKDKKSVNKTKPSVVKPLPDSILSLINDAGRVDIAVLKKLAKQHSAEQFEAFLAVPVIAGKGTIAGDIKLKEDHVEHATKMFKPADMQKEIMNETIQNAIFPLIKKLYSNQSGLLYTIGRSMDNELVIPDHAMSKVHAKIWKRWALKLPLAITQKNAIHFLRHR